MEGDKSEWIGSHSDKEKCSIIWQTGRDIWVSEGICKENLNVEPVMLSTVAPVVMKNLPSDWETWVVEAEKVQGNRKVVKPREKLLKVMRKRVKECRRETLRGRGIQWDTNRPYDDLCALYGEEYVQKRWPQEVPKNLQSWVWVLGKNTWSVWVRGKGLGQMSKGNEEYTAVYRNVGVWLSVDMCREQASMKCGNDGQILAGCMKIHGSEKDDHSRGVEKTRIDKVDLFLETKVRRHKLKRLDRERRKRDKVLALLDAIVKDDEETKKQQEVRRLRGKGGDVRRH